MQKGTYAFITVGEMNHPGGHNLTRPLVELERDFDHIQQAVYTPWLVDEGDPSEPRESLEGTERRVVEGKTRIDKLQSIIAESTSDQVHTDRSLALLATMQTTQALLEDIAQRRSEPPCHGQMKVAVHDAISEPVQRDCNENATELAAAIAHEVNQPLTTVVANASAALQWLARDVPDLDQVRECLTEVVAAGQYAGEVLANMRAMFKNDAPERGPIDFNGLIRTVLGSVQPDLTKYEVALDTQLSEHIPPLSGSRVQLQQVIMNLVTNAIQSMRSAKLRVLHVRSDPIEPCMVRVSIEDSGIGIDPSNLDRIFEPGFTTKASGMGLGLAICRSIVHRHNGRIWVSSSVNLGSTFQLELPAPV